MVCKKSSNWGGFKKVMELKHMKNDNMNKLDLDIKVETF